MIGRPELVFLDEPTAGLDPQARHATWELIEELRSSGVAVVLTTHHMDEAERLSDQVLIIDRGMVIAEGSPPSSPGPNASCASAPGPGSAWRSCCPRCRPAPRQGVAGRALHDRGRPGRPGLLAAVTAWCAAHG